MGMGILSGGEGTCGGEGLGLSKQVGKEGTISERKLVMF